VFINRRKPCSTSQTERSKIRVIVQERGAHHGIRRCGPEYHFRPMKEGHII
jgi:hypothetical protein